MMPEVWEGNIGQGDLYLKGELRVKGKATLETAPVDPTDAATKGYVDSCGSPFQWALRVSALSTTATEYLGLSGTHMPAAAESTVQHVMDWPTRLTQWRIRLATAPGAGTSRTFKILKNSVDSGVSITISGADTTGTWTGALDFAANDMVAIECTLSGVPAATVLSSNARLREIA